MSVQHSGGRASPESMATPAIGIWNRNFTQTIADLVERVRNGEQPIVSFKAQIAQKIGYPEGGMRERIIATAPSECHSSKLIEVTFDFDEFETFNTPPGNTVRPFRQEGANRPSSGRI